MPCNEKDERRIQLVAFGWRERMTRNGWSEEIVESISEISLAEKGIQIVEWWERTDRISHHQ